MGYYNTLLLNQQDKAGAKRARAERRQAARANKDARAKGWRVTTTTTVPLSDVPLCAVLHDRKLVKRGRRKRPRFKVIPPDNAALNDLADWLDDPFLLLDFDLPVGGGQWTVEVEHDDRAPWQSALPVRFQPVPDDWHFDLDAALEQLMPSLEARARAKAVKVGRRDAFVRDDVRAELVQVAAVAVLEAVDKCRDLRAFRSFALTVLEWAMDRHFRHERRWKQARSGQWNRDPSQEVMEGERRFSYADFDEVAEGLADDACVDPLDQLIDAEERKDRADLIDLVLEAVAAHRHGELALGYFLHEKTYDDLSVEYGITPANARQRVSRCIQDMRQVPELQEAAALL